MIKLMAYMAILLVVVLIGLNLAMSHALATDGERLGELGNRLEKIQEEVNALEKGVAEAKSVDNILSRAKEMGFTGLANFVNVRSEQ